MSRLDLGIALKTRAAEDWTARQDPGGAVASGTALGAASRVGLTRTEASCLSRLLSVPCLEGHFSAQISPVPPVLPIPAAPEP